MKKRPTPKQPPFDPLVLLIVNINKQLRQLKGLVMTMSENIDAIRQDLEDVKADLSEIQANVATALESIPGLQQTIADQKAVIDSLQAGDALTEQQVADLRASADVTAAQAEAVAASLRPTV